MKCLLGPVGSNIRLGTPRFRSEMILFNLQGVISCHVKSLPRLARLFSTKTKQVKATSENEDVSLGKTVFDQRNRITRISNSGKRWESVVGLEIHTQILTNSKLFSNSPNSFNKPVNSQVSYFDAAIPGTLPVLNARCVRAGVLASLAVGANINTTSFFDRKHYFYADLPAGYQITQHRKPISQGGELSFNVRSEELKRNYTKASSLVQIQIEQDSGKSLHDDHEGNSLIDLNRCGVGLLELVFGADLHHGEEAASLAQELILILQSLNLTGGRMERGEVRVDANISVNEVGAGLGTRTEVKNLNSLRSVSRAVEYEVWRQIGELERGGVVENETRGFDFESRRTIPLRDKEKKQDYRFMPEPNLPPLVLDPAMIEQYRDNLPRLPAETRKLLQVEYGLSEDISCQLVDKPDFLKLFMESVKFESVSPKPLANIILILIQEYLNDTEQELEEVDIRPQHLARAVYLREHRVINYNALRELVRLLLGGEVRSPDEVVEEKGWRLITDTKYIQEFVDDCLATHTTLVTKYIKAKEKKRSRVLTQILTEVNKDPRTEKVDMVAFNKILVNILHTQINNK